ncbi:lytic murein transglycosylase [Conexibacter sp. SYSU D00693]|uniref:lytic murein transglycosylase n=1 Tax=Conexibacter sp. SYSU D00693 TaxID=2812560 RepID=UPI00196A82C1|nr:lytic murein transglycosylase [Conexibacter sp. SYSU D00693]
MTKRKKLTAGLLVAGTFSAGFGAAVLPAPAQPRTLVITLLGGQQITVQIDVPPGTPLDKVPIPGIKLPIVSIQEVGGPAAAPTPTSPEPAPTTEQPAQTQPEAVLPDAPKAEEQAEQETTGKAKRAARKEQPAGEEQAAGQPQDEEQQAKDDADQAPADPGRTADGVPTLDNPGLSIADLGPAPVGVPNFFIEKFRIPPFLLPIYQAAGIEYGVRWEVLAAINEIETDYGRNTNVSSAGAVGWMQFLPSTWRQYGVDANKDGKKDPYNPVDAIFAAARYLKAADAAKDLRGAIFAYNHADWYVDSVLLRARLIGGLPADLVGSLTGLTQGHFPVHAKARYANDVSEADTKRRIAKGRNAALPVESESGRRSVDIFAKPGSPVIAVQDGKIVKIGKTERLGRFIQLRDVYGNTYTYAHLKKLAAGYPVPKKLSVSRDEVKDELGLDQQAKKDPKPTAPATAGAQPAKESAPAKARTTGAKPKAADTADGAGQTLEKERLFANPARKRAYKAGGEEQLLNQDLLSGYTTFKSYFTQVFGLKRSEVRIKPLQVGSKVVAGTILGRIGKTSPTKASHVQFEIRPAGRGAPRIDPKPILDGWKLLESTSVYRAQGKNPLFGPDAKTPSIGQILLMSKEQLQRQVAEDPRIELYECGRRDVQAGNIDRRVLATLSFLSASGLKPSVSSLRCGHSLMTASGNVSHHSSGNAVDIAKVNGIPILGHQGAGSITEMTIRRLLTLQGSMKPAQIISLMTFEGADNTMSLPDHADHIHVGWRPQLGQTVDGRKLDAVLKPSQWIKLIDRLGDIDNPTVRTSPSKYAVEVPKPERASDAHEGE